jgi:hypothetical protein
VRRSLKGGVGSLAIESSEKLAAPGRLRQTASDRQCIAPPD